MRSFSLNNSWSLGIFFSLNFTKRSDLVIQCYYLVTDTCWASLHAVNWDAVLIYLHCFCLFNLWGRIFSQRRSFVTSSHLWCGAQMSRCQVLLFRPTSWGKTAQMNLLVCCCIHDAVVRMSDILHIF